MSNFIRPLVFTWALLAGLAAAGFLSADGVVRDSIGPVSSGRGGTNIAHSDNLSIINDNPAGLARIGGLRAELGVDFLWTDIKYRDPQNDTEAMGGTFVLPNAAISYRVAETPRPITVGLGLFMPAGYGAEYRMDHPVFGRQKYQSEAGLYKLMPTVAVDIGGGFSAGVGLGVAYEKAGFETPYTFQNPEFMGLPGLVDLDADGFGLAWNVGVQYRVTDRLTLGVAYIAETRVELEGSFDVDATGVVPFPDSTASYDAEMENTWPRSVGIGGSYRFDKAAVSLEALWFDWSSAFDAFTFHLKNGDNPFFDAFVGPRPYDKFPLEWHDSYTVRLGGEYFLTPSDTVRAGYIYITNPIPDRTLTPLLPANLEHTVSVGYGHRFEKARYGQIGLDLAYQFAWGGKQTVGTSRVVGGDFDNSSVKAMAHWLFVGLSLTF